jgi:hypothetical protein
MFDIVTDIPQPKDLGIMFKDIITGGRVERVKSVCLLEGTIAKHYSDNPLSEKHQKYLKSRETPKNFISLVYVDTDKHVCLRPRFGTGGTQEGNIKRNKEMPSMITLIQENEIVRTVNKIEMCRLQGFPDDYCDILTTAKAGSLLGDGWTLPIIEHIFNFIER